MWVAHFRSLIGNFFFVTEVLCCKIINIVLEKPLKKSLCTVSVTSSSTGTSTQVYYNCLKKFFLLTKFAAKRLSHTYIF
jgi:hypothetical protein